MKVCLGGTFSIIHAGHEALLRRACQAGDAVVIGLTSDEMARQRGKDVAPYEERKRQLRRFARSICEQEVDIVPLDDELGPAASGACDAIVVSPETAVVAEKINDVRRSQSIPPLQVIMVPYVLADDGIPISSSRIGNGEIREGHRITPLSIAVGTSSDMKREATEEAFRRLFDDLDIRCTATAVKTAQKPQGETVWTGAMKRAEHSIGGNDYGVGIEAGIVTRHGATLLEHICALLDGTGHVTWGTAPAFQVPPGMAKTLQDTSIAAVVPDEEKSLATFLSHGAVTRKHLIGEAVTAALLARLRGRH